MREQHRLRERLAAAFVRPKHRSDRIEDSNDENVPIGNLSLATVMNAAGKNTLVLQAEGSGRGQNETIYSYVTLSGAEGSAMGVIWRLTNAEGVHGRTLHITKAHFPHSCPPLFCYILLLCSPFMLSSCP